MLSFFLCITDRFAEPVFTVSSGFSLPPAHDINIPIHPPSLPPPAVRPFRKYFLIPAWWNLVSAWSVCDHVVCQPLLSTWHITPSRPSDSDDICLYKCSGLDDFPKGRTLKWCLPNGVRKVASTQLSGEASVCQKTWPGNSQVNTFDPFSCANSCSAE